MNTRTLLAAATFAFAGSAFAQEATVFPAIDTTSSVSSAEVRAEAARALKQGALSEAAMLALPGTPAAELSRQAVRIETQRAQRSGMTDRIGAEAYSFLG